MRKRIAVVAVLLALSAILIAIRPGSPSVRFRFGAIWPFNEQTDIWCQALLELDLSDRAPMLNRPTTSIDPLTGSIDDTARRAWDSADKAKSDRRIRLLDDVRKWAPKSIKNDVDWVVRKGTYGNRSDSSETEHTQESVEKIDQKTFETCGRRMTLETGHGSA